MLIIENLRVEYNACNEILKGINLSMEAGKTYGLAGLNGTGKTTLLNTLYSFIQPVAGSILYNESPLRRSKVAYLETESYFYPYMTGKEYLSLFNPDNTEFNLENWQQLFSLPLDDITENYSTGMKKKLALLATLKMDKPILILDEPFNGLDLESAHLLTIIISQLRNKGKIILITSHIYETLTTCCDFIHHIHDGKIERSYSREQFKELEKLLHSTIEKRADKLIEGLI